MYSNYYNLSDTIQKSCFMYSNYYKLSNLNWRDPTSITTEIDSSWKPTKIPIEK